MRTILKRSNGIVAGREENEGSCRATLTKEGVSSGYRISKAAHEVQRVILDGQHAVEQRVEGLSKDRAVFTHVVKVQDNGFPRLRQRHAVYCFSQFVLLECSCRLVRKITLPITYV